MLGASGYNDTLFASFHHLNVTSKLNPLENNHVWRYKRAFHKFACTANKSRISNHDLPAYNVTKPIEF